MNLADNPVLLQICSYHWYSYKPNQIRSWRCFL